jgi:hypothetical protein
LKEITQPDLYDVRDKCAHRKWPRFADQMIAALSSMFRQAVKRGKMPFNPCTGMDDAHKADPNSNREWFQEEWNFAREKAPLEVLIPMVLARHCGLRGQTIVKVNRKQIVDHDPDRQSHALLRAQEQEDRYPPDDAGAPGLPSRTQGAEGRRHDHCQRRRHALA